MQSPLIPQNEKTRQLSVDDLNLTGISSEECFDRIVRLAAAALDLPMCAFSIIDREQQVFKASLGLAVSATPRAISFCGHAILDAQVMVVEDAAGDERFRDNPLVVDAPHIRAYIGAPIRAPDGGHIGAICGMDTSPRAFTPKGKKLISDFARMIESELLIRSMSVRDPLTGLYSNASFGGLADRCWRRARTLGVSSGLILVSVDRYLSQLRAWGRSGASEVLKHVGTCIDGTCNIPDKILARMHDDRFALFVTHQNAESVLDMAETIRRGIENQSSKQHLGLMQDFTVSLGVVTDASDARPAGSMTHMMERAHSALKKSKSSGGNRVNRWS